MSLFLGPYKRALIAAHHCGLQLSQSMSRRNPRQTITLTQNHRIIHLFNIIKILNKYKLFDDFESMLLQKL